MKQHGVQINLIRCSILPMMVLDIINLNIERILSISTLASALGFLHVLPINRT